jgi:hypothetical protein
MTDSLQFIDNSTPYKIMVSVFPAKNPIPERHLTARCTFDTGCDQGNIVSLDLAHRLGFAEFEKLDEEEVHGGNTITGGRLNPMGAVHLSWYHGSSGQVFRDMRFLVLADAKVDLLIGSKSIFKHNLMAGPNFNINVVPPGGTFFPCGPSSLTLELIHVVDKNTETRKLTVSDRKTQLEDLQRKLRKLRKTNPVITSDDKEVRHLEKKIEKAQNALKIAEEKDTLGKIQAQRCAYPKNEDLRQQEVRSEFRHHP